MSPYIPNCGNPSGHSFLKYNSAYQRCFHCGLIETPARLATYFHHHHPTSMISNISDIPAAPQPAFAFRDFQVEDFSRAAMHPGAIVALDPGGGKTFGIYSIPFMRGSRRTLIVAPASLIEQIQDEGEKHFGIRPIIIRNQDDAYAMMRNGILPSLTLDCTGQAERSAPADSIEDPEFFITDYKWLGYNGSDECPPKQEDDDDALASSSPGPALNLAHHIPAPYRHNIGMVRDYDGWQIKCVGSPSLSTLITHAFDTVCCDEGVRLKSGEDAHIARGVLQLCPENRFVFTGTPIKNKLSDSFFLISWVCGYSVEPTARWPFGRSASDQHDFCRNHLIIEENHTAYQRTGRRLVKMTNKICNVHRLWKLFGPIIIRRRKDDMGDLVRKVFKPLHFAPGKDQFATYHWHACNPPKKKTPLASIGTQLANLRMAAIAPWSTTLGQARASTVMNPKIAGILQLTADLMEQDEQLVVFSPFQEFASMLSGFYRDAGVPHAILDGRLSPQKRGSLSKAFKARELAVVICGIESMGEGHSFHMASNLVLPSLTWAWDKNAQAIDRVHRLISPKDVTIWLMTAKGTIDERLLSMFQEKGDSNDLALDGRLFQTDREEVNLADLLRETLDSFDPTTKTIDESEVRKNYTAVLAPRLSDLANQWVENHRPSLDTVKPARAPRNPRRSTEPAPAAPTIPAAATAPAPTQKPAPAPAPVKPLDPPAPRPQSTHTPPPSRPVPAKLPANLIRQMFAAAMA